MLKLPLGILVLESIFLLKCQIVPQGHSTNLRFFRSSDFQSEDVYAIYASPDKIFAIQLDPDCAVICLWDEVDYPIEIGDWSTEPYDEAINFMQEHFLEKA